LGMDICRACAAFYKRAKMTGKEYPCRRGTHQCLITKDNNFVCRRCRFEKCNAVGLIYDGPMRVRAKPPIPLMEKIEKEFKSLMERRRSRELIFMRTCQHSGTIPHPREKIYIVNANASAELHMIGIEESWVFFRNTFQELDSLEQKEKEIIFKDYVAKLGLIACYYWTREIWGDVRKKLMSSVITCFDAEIPLDVYYPDDYGNKGAFESSIRSHNDEHSSIFLPQFNITQMTDKEFYALAALVLTEHDLPITEEAEQMMDAIRHETFENLQLYYQNELGISNFSTRLGNLMSLNHTVQECMSLYRVVFSFYSTFFDMYMSEEMMKTMLY
ncbi:hypothetical protein PENTCL1PPCAC_16881, partial [Pristionchus entomophagus]